MEKISCHKVNETLPINWYPLEVSFYLSLEDAQKYYLRKKIAKVLKALILKPKK